MLTARTSERQGRLIDSDETPRWRRRSARAISDERARRSTLAAYLAAQEKKSLLRFLTCGCVDDGKSTLIGRLLYDSEAALRGPAGGAGEGLARSTARPATTSISRCWSTGWRPSASRASPSTSPTASSRPTSASSSSPTRPATSSTRATWRPAPRTPSSPSS